LIVDVAVVVVWYFVLSVVGVVAVLVLVLVVDFVDVMLQSSRGELSNLGGILIDRFVFVVSDKCVKII